MTRALVALLIVLTLIVTACANELNAAPGERSVPGGSADRGRELIASYGCGACHTIDGVPGAHGTVGPPLRDFHKRSTIAGQLPNTALNLIRWVQDPQAIRPGTDMPNLGVTPDEARDIAAYLYNQSSSWSVGR